MHASTTVRLSSLHKMAQNLYSTIRDLPFKLSGTCSALVYHGHGLPSEQLCAETGFLMQREGIDRTSNRLVWIKMLAAPVNPADLNQIQGVYPLEAAGPTRVGGNEGVGIVVATSGESALKAGDWVVPRRGAFGTWREQVVCYDEDVQVVSQNLPLAAAAAFIVNPPTAYRLLRDFASPQKGDIIVQNGANSAVGRYTIQMAKNMGIKTVNIIRDRPHYEALEKELYDLGATMVVKSTEFSKQETQNYITRVIGGQPILGFNCVGGIATTEMSRFLSEGSTLVTYGGMAGKNPAISASSLIFRDIRYVGFWMSRWYQQANSNREKEAEREKMFTEITEMFENGGLEPPNVKQFDFKESWREAIEMYTNPATQIRSSDAKPLFIINK
jgi:trans-2-enoyl-CoA reductase